MKKRTIIIIVAVVAAVLIAGAVLIAVLCDGGGTGKIEGHTYTVDGTQAPEDAAKDPLVLEGDTYVISEDNYVNGVNEIYGNAEKYIGKKIQLEGEYIAEMYENEMYYQVYRTLVEHCDEDHDHSQSTHNVTRVGFRISYDGNKPSDKSFVRVVGVVDTYEADGKEYLIINAESLVKCENVGAVEISH